MKVYKGAIVACDRENSTYEYLVEDRGRILYTGRQLPAAFINAPCETLGERALLPCFGDTHLHFASYALFNAGLDVRSATDLPGMCAQIAEYARGCPDNILMGFGVSPHSIAERRLISKTELDHVCPGRPLYIVKYDGHTCVINSALAALLPKKTKNLRGFHQDTGEMSQEAFFAVTNFITKKISPIRTLQNMLGAVDALALNGVGLMHTNSGVGFPFDLDVTLETLLGRGLNSGFQTRLFFQTMDLAKVRRRKLPRVGGCFATALDGCLGSRDAALRRPYTNEPGNTGILYYRDEEVVNFTKQANREGLQIELHAIGDAAFDQAVMALEAALKDCPRTDHRHGIIHACLPTNEGLKKCAALGIQLPLQPAFLAWNLEPLSYLRGVLGERAYELLPLRAMADLGIILSGGSDAPCTPPNPIAGIHAACNHYVPGQSLTIAQALKLFTYNAAWTTFDEKERGSLEAGKTADMVILNQNPLAMKPGNLLELKVERLLLKGKPYQKGQGIFSLLVRGLLARGQI